MDTLPLVMPADAEPGFDYSSLPAEMVSRRQEQANRIRGMYRQTVETAGEIGRELLAAQEEMEHGQFLPWVTGAVGLSKSTAYRCMDMARAFGTKLPTVGSLPIALVQKLSEKSTPEPVRASVLRRIEAGETIKADKILDEVREAKAEARKRSTAEREASRRAALTQDQRNEEDALKARGERGRAARERRDEKEREEREIARAKREAEITRGATALVDMLGPNRAAAFLARFGNMLGVLEEANREAHRRRAQDVEPTEIHMNKVYRIGSLYGFLDPEKAPQIQELAREIECDGLKEFPIVLEDGHDAAHPYRVIGGIDIVHALNDVLHWHTIPVRIVPPVSADDLAIFDAADE